MSGNNFLRPNLNYYCLKYSSLVINNLLWQKKIPCSHSMLVSLHIIIIVKIPNHCQNSNSTLTRANATQRNSFLSLWQNPQTSCGWSYAKLIFSLSWAEFTARDQISKDICQRVSSKGCLPPKILFQKGHLPSMVVFHQRSYSVKVCISLKVVFHHFPSKVIFH